MNHKRKKINLFALTIIIIITSIITLISSFTRCNQTEPQNTIINPEGKTLVSRFNPPAGFHRVESSENSFARYLQTLPLKKSGSKVRLYNGNLKANQAVHEAVVDISVGTKNLQQCADACMRLRAEYLFKAKQFNKIHFKLSNGFDARYEKWTQGYRIKIEGNKTNWIKRSEPSNTHADLMSYLEIVFSYAGTLSLSKELKKVKLNEMEPGDMFITGGSPGHAVMVVDMTIHPETKQKLFMLVQSYMPAQDIHILKNLNNNNLSPWYPLNFGLDLNTPEWNFSTNDLMRFGD